MPEKPTELQLKSELFSIADKARGYTEEQTEKALHAVRYALDNVDDLPMPVNGEIAKVCIKEQLPALDIGFVKDCYYQNEQGDSYIFDKLYHNRVVYDNTAKRWHIWNGVHWQADKNTIKFLFIVQVSNQYHLSAMSLNAEYAAKSAEIGRIKDGGGKISKDDIEKRDQLKLLSSSFMERCNKLRALNRTKRILELSEALMGVQGEVWDNNPMLLGVNNGTVDLTTGQLKDGNPSDYIKTASSTDFDPHAKCPRFEQFILEIFGGDIELARFIQRLIGYSIAGLATEHIFPIFWGEDGRNGKSTLVTVLKDILSPLMKPIHSDVIIDTGRNGGATPFLMELKGLRLGYVSETEKQAKLKEATIKLITGGDIIVGRGLYEKAQEWKPTHQIFLITNPKPVIDCLDGAIWERIILIPFIHRFVENPDPDNPFEHKRDTELIEKLQSEISGALNWSIAGCLEWQKHGLQIPESVKAVTETYHQEADNFPDFIEENCILQTGACTPVKDMRFSYESFSYDDPNKLTHRKFNKRMESLGFSRQSKNGKKVWINIELYST